MSYVSVEVPDFISERQHTEWVDCVDCALVMLSNCAKPGVAPATLTEAQALRKQAGYPSTGGTDPTNYGKAIHDRYGLSGRAFTGTDAALIATLPEGTGAAVCGDPANFPVGDPLRRFTGSFDGGHCVLVLHLEGSWWWVDPAGPENGSYHGQLVTEAQVQTFYTNGKDGGCFVMPLATEVGVSIYERIPGTGTFTVTKNKTAHGLVIANGSFVASGNILTSGGGKYDYALHNTGTGAPTTAYHVTGSTGAALTGEFVNSGEVDEVPDPVPPTYTDADLTKAYNDGVDAAAKAASGAKK
jgi:hypothetical protein